MNETWNLDPIYRGFDDPAFSGDLQALENVCREFAAFSCELETGDPDGNLRRGIEYLEKLTVLGGRLVEYASLRQAANARDPQAGSRLGNILAVFSDTAAPQAAFEAWAAKLPDLTQRVAQDESLREYGFLFSKILENSRYLLSAEGEQIMAKMQLSGGSAWEDLHGTLTSTVPVIYRGGTLNLPAVRNLAYDPDPQVRKDAYEAELACYDRIKDSVAYALNSLKLETLTDCSLRGYESPLERTLKHDCVKRETLDAMFGAIDEYLPHFHKYLKAKAKALGHEKGLPWYDLFAPMGESGSKFTTQQTRDYLVSLFSGFDRELVDMVARAFDESWIDFYPREGKQGGAFCAGIECLGESRVLTNFDGMFTDIVTLAHELGHAFHNQCTSGHRPLNRDYSMPVAETASTFNECVVLGAAIRDAGSRGEKLALIESQLQDVTQIICDIYSRFLFESRVFENRKEQFMDADTLCAMMLQAQKECYGDGLDQDILHPYMWICKSHYYGSTFYNFPYAFGGLFARGLYARYEAEGAAFVPKYKALLRTATVATAEDAALSAGIDLTDRAFWRSALQTVADRIDQFCALMEQ